MRLARPEIPAGRRKQKDPTEKTQAIRVETLREEMENKEERQGKKTRAQAAHPEIILLLLLIRSTAGEEREMEKGWKKGGLVSRTAITALTALITTRGCGT